MIMRDNSYLTNWEGSGDGEKPIIQLIDHYVSYVCALKSLSQPTPCW